MTKKELMQLIAEGEGFYLEFKRDLNSDFKKELVAFANASGGKILLGVEDNGEIKGVKIDNNFRSQVQQHATECDPPIDIDMKDVENVMVVTVHEGKHKPYRSTNGFYLRVGPNSQKMATDKIAEYVERYGRVRFDERVIRSVRFDGSLDQKLVSRFIEMAQIKNVFQNKTHILSSLGVVKEIDGVKYFTNAGILFFTNSPNSIIKQAQITCVAYNGKEKIDILDRKDFKEDIITSIESGLAFIRRHLNEASDIKSLKREDKLEIPLVALREALVNAVAHRDYLEAGANVVVEIYADRVVISNPGGLPHGLSAKDFGKYSLSRNPVIADLLLRVGLIEKLGTGVNRIKGLLKEAGLPEAEFYFNDFFSVTFWRQNTGDSTALNTNKKGGQKSGQKSSQKGGQKLDVFITPKQDSVLALIYLKPDISRAEIARQLKINESAVQKHLTNLKTKGIIERVGPAKGGYWKVNIEKD